MPGPEILKPAFAMAGLTCAVWIYMYVLRIRQLWREGIGAQEVATSAQSAALLTDTRASDNFRNLFELPVLFYVALFVAHATGVVTPVSLGLAWAFVFLRVVHSLVHCTYNKVMHRFLIHVTGALVLWTLWGYLAWHQAW
jgi:hypothetical protein